MTRDTWSLRLQDVDRSTTGARLTMTTAPLWSKPLLPLTWATASASEVNPCSHPCFLQSIRMILIKGKWIMILRKPLQWLLSSLEWTLVPTVTYKAFHVPPPVVLLAYLHPAGWLPVPLTLVAWFCLGAIALKRNILPLDSHITVPFFQVLNQMSLSQWSSLTTLFNVASFPHVPQSMAVLPHSP